MDDIHRHIATECDWYLSPESESARAEAEALEGIPAAATAASSEGVALGACVAEAGMTMSISACV